MPQADERGPVEPTACTGCGIAEAFRYAAGDRARYADFFAPDGSLDGPGFTAADAADLPEDLRELMGVVVTPVAESAAR